MKKNFDGESKRINATENRMDRETGRDCVTQMLMLRQRPDVLAAALRDMGVTESGDGLPDDGE